MANDNTPVTLRVQREISDEVRRLAKRDGETQSTVLRRLIRLGLQRELERQDTVANAR